MTLEGTHQFNEKANVLAILPSLCASHQTGKAGGVGFAVPSWLRFPSQSWKGHCTCKGATGRARCTIHSLTCNRNVANDYSKVLEGRAFSLRKPEALTFSLCRSSWDANQRTMHLSFPQRRSCNEPELDDTELNRKRKKVGKIKASRQRLASTSPTAPSAHEIFDFPINSCPPLFAPLHFEWWAFINLTCPYCIVLGIRIIMQLSSNRCT